MLKNIKRGFSAKRETAGFIHILGLLLLIAGLIAGIYLVQQTQIFKPKASSAPTGPTTSFNLSPNTSFIQAGGTVKVFLSARSDVTSANLFDAKVNFDPTILKVIGIDYTSSSINSWVEQYIDNTNGTVSLIGGVPNPGVKTTVGTPGLLMANIHFSVSQDKNTSVNIGTDAAIYSNDTNTNILVYRDSISLQTKPGSPAPTASPSASPSPTADPYSLEAHPTSEVVMPISQDGSGYGINALLKKDGQLVADQGSFGYSWGGYDPSIVTVTPASICLPGINSPCPFLHADLKALKAGKTTIGVKVTDKFDGKLIATTTFNVSVTSPIVGTGDGNGDGKVNLIDLSVLLSDFNKTGSIRNGIDLNGDGVINTFDFGLMRNLLISKGVIKG